ncbi:hypothetical protein [Verrucosispora sp. NA02020]|uniref:hypothetical protein n=1 Tax=Verrucosispora sp. NA02020 TaxID=2742132 RepID=UPI00158FB3FD|nr:hypothetical protein [Verrucosispora sp. NA02020]QKW15345.1 hypothetical protein HUT12_23000 [Verrucosispora sp. NA02020]
MPNRAWHAILGIKLDTLKPNLGHPDLVESGDPVLADLWQYIINDRTPGTLECTDGEANCPGWLIPVVGPYRHFRHYNPGESGGPAAKSDEHKAWQEYVVNRTEQHGLTATVEARSRTGRRIQDVHVEGGTVPLSAEIQVSYIHPSTIARRVELDQTAGDTPLWIANHPLSPAINRAPWSRVAKDTPQRILAGTADLLLGGAMTATWEECGRRHPNCPATGRRPCGQKHVFLDPTRGLHLDQLVVGAATGQFRPTRRRDGKSIRHIWLTADDYERYHDDQADQQDTEDNSDPQLLPNDSTVCRYGEASPRKLPAKPRDSGGGLYVPERPRTERDSGRELGSAKKSAGVMLSGVLPDGPSTQPRGVCGAGVTPCGEPARLYPAGWRCDAHVPSSPWKRR